MSDKLFRKVNKKRGLELKNVKQDITKIMFEVLDYVKFNLEIVKKILKRINIKDSKREFDRGNPDEGDDYSFPFNEDDFSLVEKAFKGIEFGFIRFTSLSTITSINEDDSIYNPLINLLTRAILESRAVIEDKVNKIVSNITKIKREKFRRDIDYAIYVLKDVETRLLKTRKEIASLFARG